LLHLVEAAGDFINRHDIFNRNVLVDGLQDAVMIFDVKLVVGLDQLQMRAKPPSFMHQRAGFYAQGLRGVAGSDGAGGFRHSLHDYHRPVPQRGSFLLLARSEKAV
jgi:hypothetical protein